MKKLSLKEIEEYRTRDLIEGLRERKFSLLGSMGFRKLRAGMFLTGLACRLIVFLSGLGFAVKKAGDRGLKMNAPARKRIGNLLRFLFPVDVKGEFPHPHHGMVVGFNHPSLGEILRMIYICIDNYKHNRNLFPVNLPWYEALMPIVEELEAIGIYVMPIITPATRDKMAKQTDEETMKVIDSLAKSLNLVYLEKCVEFIKDGDNIWIAPSATRQASVYKTLAMFSGDEAIEPKTMTLVASALIRAKVEECTFLPVAVIPSDKYSRGLNFFRHYRFGIGKALTMNDARENVRKRCEKNTGRKFEAMFLEEISRALIKNNGSRFVCPDT